MLDPHYLEIWCDYFPAIKTALDILLEYQKRRLEDNKEVKKYYKPKPKITNTDIDQIIGLSFGFNQRYAGELRRCMENDKKITPTKNKIFNLNPETMKVECNKLGIDISADEIKAILVLSNLALPVSSVLKGGLDVPLHESAKESAESWIKALDGIVKSDIPYWKLFFKYMHDFKLETEIWTLLMALPSIPENNINRLLHQFDHVSSFNSVKKTLRNERAMKYLLDYKDELFALKDRTATDICDKSEVFDNMSLHDLCMAYKKRDCIQAISRSALRPNDLYLIYLFETQLNHATKEIMWQQIADLVK